MRKPCANCPWRVDAPRRYWHSDHFQSIWRNCQDDGHTIMQCHKSAQSDESLVCQGWVRVMQTEAVGVRIALLRKHATVEEMLDQDVPELFATFEDMMRANNIELPPRNRNQ